MKKALKIILITLGIIMGIILLDTIQARLFKNSPIISWKESLAGDSWVKKGIIVDTYYCTKDDVITVSWHFNTSKFTCPIEESNNNADRFKLIFHQEMSSGKRKIIDKNNSELYDYDIYTYDGSVDVIINGNTYTLEKALKDKIITMEEIIDKAKEDIKNPVMYKDGGSMEYHYDTYTIIKFNTLDGDRDVYIGNKDLALYDID